MKNWRSIFQTSYSKIICIVYEKKWKLKNQRRNSRHSGNKKAILKLLLKTASRHEHSIGQMDDSYAGADYYSSCLNASSVSHCRNCCTVGRNDRQDSVSYCFAGLGTEASKNRFTKQVLQVAERHMAKKYYTAQWRLVVALVTSHTMANCSAEILIHEITRTNSSPYTIHVSNISFRYRSD